MKHARRVRLYRDATPFKQSMVQLDLFWLGMGYECSLHTKGSPFESPAHELLTCYTQVSTDYYFFSDRLYEWKFSKFDLRWMISYVGEYLSDVTLAQPAPSFPFLLFPRRLQWRNIFCWLHFFEERHNIAPKLEAAAHSSIEMKALSMLCLEDLDTWQMWWGFLPFPWTILRTIPVTNGDQLYTLCTGKVKPQLMNKHVFLTHCATIVEQSLHFRQKVPSISNRNSV